MTNYRNNVNIHQCLITKCVNDISLRATSLLVTRVKLNVFSLFLNCYLIPGYLFFPRKLQ